MIKKNNLEELIAAETQQQMLHSAVEMTAYLRETYGPEVKAILFYGSCLRLHRDDDLILDFYVLLDRLRPAIKNPLSALFGSILPPNVYYHECKYKNKTIRAKVAIMTLKSFYYGASRKSFSPSIWARFSQPTMIAFAYNNKTCEIIQKALANSVITLIEKTIPIVHDPNDIVELWTSALKETYKSELRPEKLSKIKDIINDNPERYVTFGKAALKRIKTGSKSSKLNRATANWIWFARRLWGKSLNFLRLIKASFTFNGGIDYLAWKIEKHTDLKLHLTEKEKSRPLITGLKMFFKLKRMGKIK